MIGLIRFHNHLFSGIRSSRLPNGNPCLALVRFSHYGTESGFVYSDTSTSITTTTTSEPPQKNIGNKVAIFWNLDNKPPNAFPPFDAANRLKKAASSFGFVRYMVAYANHHAFSYVPPVVRDLRNERKVLNRLENRGVVKPSVPYVCRVSGRKFHTNDKLIHHLKQIHDREQTKRLNRLESSRGKRRVQLVGKLSMKMEKYKYAAKDILTPKVGYGLADELKRAGFWVRLVSDKPQAADIALRSHMVDMMDRKRADCIVLVSDDSDFVDVLREARLRCLKTIVVADNNDGALKRCADAAFSWREILLGKAKKVAVSVVGSWKDRDVLKSLEWTYKSDLGEHTVGFDDTAIESEDVKDIVSDKGGDLVKTEDIRPWWVLDSDIDDTSAKSSKLFFFCRLCY